MQVAVFGSSSVDDDDPRWAEARRLGAAIAAAGHTLATGGYGGYMAAVSHGAVEAGTRVVGVTAPTLFPSREGPNEWVTDERPASSLAERVGTLIDGSGAVIALPGAVGTLAELLVAWHGAQIDRAHGRPAREILAVGDEWQALVAGLEASHPTARGLVSTVASIDEAIRWLAELPEDA
ncbi:MAG: LOG family protein [Acidimicrobiia bacterium]